MNVLLSWLKGLFAAAPAVPNPGEEYPLPECPEFLPAELLSQMPRRCDGRRDIVRGD